MGKFLIGLILLTLVLISGCSISSQPPISQRIKNETQEPIEPKNNETKPAFQCTAPYEIVGQRCCLDKNNNSVCDEEDLAEKPTPIQTSVQPDNNQTFLVSKVIDGDTIELDHGTKVRLLGINAPEKGQPYYTEAAKKLKELVEGKNITLEADVQDTDRYERLLRYVFVDGLFVNSEMVKEGYAIVYIVKPNIEHEKELRDAWNECRKNSTNLCKSPENSVCNNNCLGIFNFHFDSQGNDNENLNDEYVKIKNSCQYSCDLTGWAIGDEANHVYQFKKFSIGKDGVFTLYTGSGKDTETDLYWGSGKAIWNNDGDTLFLINSEGELVLDYTYIGR